MWVKRSRACMHERDTYASRYLSPMTPCVARRCSAKPLVLRLMCALLIAFVMLSAESARAGAFDLNDASWEGCAELLDLARNELGEERVVVLSTLDWEKVAGTDGILILHPERPVDAEEAAAFMKAGGRLAVLD